MDEKEKLLNWLFKHDLISIHRLEGRLGLKGHFLSQAIKRTKNLPDKYVEPLKAELKKYGYRSKEAPGEDS